MSSLSTNVPGADGDSRPGGGLGEGVPDTGAGSCLTVPGIAASCSHQQSDPGGPTRSGRHQCQSTEAEQTPTTAVRPHVLDRRARPDRICIPLRSQAPKGDGRYEQIA